MILLFLPHFPGAPQKRGLLLPKQAAAFWEGTDVFEGGTGKAEAAKLPDAGISPKSCPGKRTAEKTRTVLSRNRAMSWWNESYGELGGEGPEIVLDCRHGQDGARGIVSYEAHERRPSCG